MKRIMLRLDEIEAQLVWKVLSKEKDTTFSKGAYSEESILKRVIEGLEAATNAADTALGER